VLDVHQVDAHRGGVAQLGEQFADELPGHRHPSDLLGGFELDHDSPPSRSGIFIPREVGYPPGMVRHPLTAEQIAAGQRLGSALRAARAGRSLVEVALAAGISPETLRKIEAGRLPAPAFGTVVCLSRALDVPLGDLAEVWLADMPVRRAS
jgi:hypothetical protein